MIPIPLKEDLEKQLIEMPELEQEEESIDELIMKEEIRQGTELIHKRMNDIYTFQAHENEVYLRGTDEYGKDFQICFDSYDFLKWIDTEHLEYIKEKLIKHIQEK
tara:strand:- start:344 stop:658 length:315 start_codon:yes stop_codon:yes gene_type:complete